jgi:hypothetical protein
MWTETTTSMPSPGTVSPPEAPEAQATPAIPETLPTGLVSSLASRAARRRTRARSRRQLAFAMLACVGIPTLLLLSLWRNLTESFWYNEQWRAYYVSAGGNWWATVKSDGAPFSAGWYFLERFSGDIFGSTELALRLPVALFLPVGCLLLMLLARRWMSTPAATVVAVVGSLTGTLVSFAVQLSEYQIDAAAVVSIVLLYEIARDVDPAPLRSTRTYLCYGGIAVACVFSTPAVFVAAPLLLLDVYRAGRRRNLDAHALGAVGAGAVALAHLALFVLPQSATELRTDSYWAPQFLPHHDIGSWFPFVWHGVTGFVSGAFSSSSQVKLPGLLISGVWTPILTALFGALLCVGIVDFARSARGRPILFAMGGSLALPLIASYQRYWPFGFVRTNFYLLPLLMLIAGVGGVRTWGYGVSMFRSPASESAPTVAQSRSRRLAFVGGTALCVLVAAGVAIAATEDVGAYRQLRGSTAAPQFGADIGQAVFAVQRQAQPHAAVLVAGGGIGAPGWRYYEFEYGGKAAQAGHPLAPSQVDFFVNHGSWAITRFVARRKPTEVFLYEPEGSTGPELGADAEAISKGSPCHQVAQKTFAHSGLLVTMSCTRP